jgi:hypothetical protein
MEQKPDTVTKADAQAIAVLIMPSTKEARTAAGLAINQFMVF